MTEGRPPRSLVLCVGNDLVADDAAGCRVYQRLLSQPLPPGARLELLGVGGIALLDCLDGEENLVVVDAVRLGAAPGTVHVIEWDDLPRLSVAPVSLHGIGIREAIEVGRRIAPDLVPRRVVLIGIEGQCFDQVGVPPTREVAAAIAPASDAVLRCLTRLAGRGAIDDPPLGHVAMPGTSTTQRTRGVEGP